MQRIKTFRTFESVTGGLTPEQKMWLNECTYGTWTVNAEGLVDVEGDFDCSYRDDSDVYNSDGNLSDFKGVRFGKVGGYFDCSGNKFTSLEGSPREVEDFFSCSNNKLTSLVGAPGKVGGSFWCNDNSLTSLEGAPGDVRWNFECDKNPLQTLVGAPQKIEGRFLFSTGVEAPEFEIEEHQWGPEGWLQALEDIDDPKARGLVLTLLDPNAINKLFVDQPEQTMIDLQGVWNLPSFVPIRKQLKVPERYRDDMDLLGDMKELGF